MAALASSSQMILHRFILRRSTPFLTSQSFISQSSQSITSLKTTPYFNPSPSSTRSLFTSLAPANSLNDVGLLENVKIELENGTNANSAADTSSSEGLKISNTPAPSLSVKEKKELASYAHSLGKKLKSQQVGKSGITDNTVMALLETLEANELLKLKIHNTCPGEFEDVVKQLEENTGSLVVGQIGRTVILYRPSPSKLKAEEKKKEAQRLILKRQTQSKPFPQSKRPASEPGQETRQYGRGRRGTSRY